MRTDQIKKVIATALKTLKADGVIQSFKLLDMDSEPSKDAKFKEYTYRAKIIINNKVVYSNVFVLSKKGSPAKIKQQQWSEFLQTMIIHGISANIDFMKNKIGSNGLPMF